MVSYMIFLWVLKKINFCSKSIGVSVRFYQKSQVLGKNTSKLHISWSWTPYCKTVIYNGPVFEFLRVLKNFSFSNEIHRCLAYDFTENRKFGAKTNWNSIFLGQDPCSAKRLSITVPYLNFYGFRKILHFRSKFIGVSLRFYRKLPDWGKNRSKLCISWSRPPYSESVIYNAPVFQFLRVLKNFTFLLEIQRC
jgi:hypothetical protein